MPWGRLATLLVSITLKDVTEYRNQILFSTAANLLAAVSWATGLGVPLGYLRGFLLTMVCFAPIAYAQFCFYNERQRDTLPILLGLPVRAEHVIYAKYISMWLISLVTVTGPVLVADSPRLAMSIAVAALFCGTFAMSVTVTSEKPWAFQIPLWIFLALGLIVLPVLSRRFPGIQLSALQHHTGALAFVLLLTIPAMVFLSTKWFCKKSTFSGKR